MTMFFQRAFLLAGIAAAALMLVACGSGADDATIALGSTATRPELSRGPFEQVPGALVGRIENTEAFVAVLREGDRVRAYVCDGTREKLTLAKWFEGRWTGDGPVTLRSGSLALTLREDGGAVTGYLTTADGAELPFRAKAPSGHGGLYKLVNAAKPKYTITLDGEDRGAVAWPVTRCSLVRKTVVLADGTTATVVVEVCRAVVG